MQLSETEWKVMGVLWGKHPASARDVLDALAAETGWAYTTTKTILARLAGKGAVAVSMRGNTSQYEPLVSRDDARRVAVKGLLERAFDGTFGALLHHMVDEEHLSPNDMRDLRALLDEEQSKRGGKA